MDTSKSLQHLSHQIDRVRNTQEAEIYTGDLGGKVERYFPLLAAELRELYLDYNNYLHALKEESQKR